MKYMSQHKSALNPKSAFLLHCTAWHRLSSHSHLSWCSHHSPTNSHAYLHTNCLWLVLLVLIPVYPLCPYNNYEIPPVKTHSFLQGEDMKVVENYWSRLDRKCNTKAVYGKWQSRLYFLNVCSKFPPVQSSLQLMKKAGSELGTAGCFKRDAPQTAHCCHTL